MKFYKQYIDAAAAADEAELALGVVFHPEWTTNVDQVILNIVNRSLYGVSRWVLACPGDTEWERTLNK